MKPLILTLIALFISLNGWAQTSTITYQGKLLDASASPVTNSSMPMTFAIYSAETGGTKLWPSGSAAAKIVDVDYGLYTVTLGTGSGSDEAFTSTVFAGGSAWLEVSVNGTTLARTRLTTVPFSYHAASLDGATWEEPGAIGATTPGTGKFTNLTVGAYSFPSADGSNGQVLTTNGSGAVNWETPAEAPVTSVAENGSTPLVVSPTTGNVQISIGQANGTSDGYLSSTDWTIFNNKSTLALGETNSTAYRGDHGKAAYDERGSQIDGTGLNWDGSKLEVTWDTPGDIGGTTPAAASFTGAYIGAYQMPYADGTNGQVMITDGSGAVSWTTAAGLNFDPASPGNIGYTTPAKASFTGMSVDVPSSSPLTAKGYISTNLNCPVSVYVSGSYAYVASFNNDRLCIYDISDTDNIIAKGYISTNLSDPRSVYVSGSYAYVASFYNNRLCVFDISDTDNIVAKGYISTNLSDPRSVYVSGSYAYVASYDNDRLCVFDISDPDNIVAKGYTSTNLNGPYSVYVSGSYAYVTNYWNNRLCIYDISDPDNIVAKGYTSTNLNDPYSVYVSGSYAYVASFYNNRLCVFDISNPDNIVAKGYTNTNLAGPCSVYVSGSYAYVTNYWNNRLCVFDISDPDNIVAKGYTNTNLAGPYSVYVSGSYVYVASADNNRLCAYEINSVETPAIQAGSIGADDMDIANNVKIGNDLHVRGGSTPEILWFRETLV